MSPSSMQTVHVSPKQVGFGWDCGMLRRDSGTRREKHLDSRWNQAMTGSPRHGPCVHGKVIATDKDVRIQFPFPSRVLPAHSSPYSIAVVSVVTPHYPVSGRVLGSRATPGQRA